MRVGDEFPVEIKGKTIAMATVKEIDHAANQVLLEVPGKYVIMSFTQELQEVAQQEPEKQVVLESATTEQLDAANATNELPAGPTAPAEGPKEGPQPETTQPVPQQPTPEPEPAPDQTSGDNNAAPTQPVQSGTG